MAEYNDDEDIYLDKNVIDKLELYHISASYKKKKENGVLHHIVTTAHLPNDASLKYIIDILQLNDPSFFEVTIESITKII